MWAGRAFLVRDHAGYPKDATGWPKTPNGISGPDFAECLKNQIGVFAIVIHKQNAVSRSHAD